MPTVVIGVDPHKASNTLVVIDAHEQVVGEQRFVNDRAGYRSMKTFARAFPERTWAVEGARGVGAGLAQRLVARVNRCSTCRPNCPPGFVRSVVAAVEDRQRGCVRGGRGRPARP